MRNSRFCFAAAADGWLAGLLLSVCLQDSGCWCACRTAVGGLCSKLIDSSSCPVPRLGKQQQEGLLLFALRCSFAQFVGTGRRPVAFSCPGCLVMLLMWWWWHVHLERQLQSLLQGRVYQTRVLLGLPGHSAHSLLCMNLTRVSCNSVRVMCRLKHGKYCDATVLQLSCVPLSFSGFAEAHHRRSTIITSSPL